MTEGAKAAKISLPSSMPKACRIEHALKSLAVYNKNFPPECVSYTHSACSLGGEGCHRCQERKNNGGDDKLLH